MAQPVHEVIQNDSPDATITEQAGLIVQQLRIRQWPKNLIVLIPLLFSGYGFQLEALRSSLTCLIGFCLISSGIYIFNDIMDVVRDRTHPTKRLRPIASGKLKIPIAALTGTLLLLSGGLISYSVRPSLFLICLAYVVFNFMYSVGLKNIAILDVMCISSGFVFRALAGAVAIQVMPSGWFLLCTTLGALFLALEKRRHELSILQGDSSSHREALSDYSPALIARMESVIVPSLLTSYAFYTFQSPHGQWMMVTIPVVLYGLMRYQLLSERGILTGTPEEVLLKDRPIQLTVLIWVILCAFVVYLHPGGIVRAVADYVDTFRLFGR